MLQSQRTSQCCTPATPVVIGKGAREWCKHCNMQEQETGGCTSAFAQRDVLQHGAQQHPSVVKHGPRGASAGAVVQDAHDEQQQPRSDAECVTRSAAACRWTSTGGGHIHVSCSCHGVSSETLCDVWRYEGAFALSVASVCVWWLCIV